MTGAEPGCSSGLVPRLNQIHAFPSENKLSTVHEQIVNDNERCSPDNDPIPTTSSHITQDRSNETGLNTVQSKFHRSLDESVDDGAQILIEQVLQQSVIELKKFDRPKERVFAEADIFSTLKQIIADKSEDRKMFRVGSSFYRCTNHKSDFNILVNTSKNFNFSKAEMNNFI